MNETFSALADPTRRAILGLLAEQDLSVGEVVGHFDIAQSGITRHLNVLEDAHLIQRRREGQRRVCSLSPTSLSEVDAWIEPYRHYWNSALRRLEETVKKERPAR
ncbi:MAG: metalloregulator ArsR/SmtB family transcription factor [Pseudomonadota bacterium]